MTPDAVFGIANLVALTGWLLLGISLRVHGLRVVPRLVIPLALSALYVVLIATHLAGSGGGFGTLSQVAALFENRWLLLAGWVHYLAFDLFTGAWEATDALQRGVPVWALLPCLVLTFLFGPAGLLLYFLARSARRRTARGSQLS
jgi:hypothetical protein